MRTSRVPARASRHLTQRAVPAEAGAQAVQYQRGKGMGPRRQRRDPIVLIPRVADQRFFLSPEQDQDGADDGEHQRDRLIEKIGLDQALPDPRPRPALDLRLQRRQRVWWMFDQVEPTLLI